ncbi:MAG: HAD family hydrolase [Opitutaceae bacterium]|nr:HAD family hydrolase [Opitutaceae bacterium]
MNVRAVIFDVYQTLLAVGPAPADRDARWQELTRATFGPTARLGLEDFILACDAVIAREHAVSRTAGIRFPEIFWPDVVREVIPAFGALPAAAQADFLLRQKSLLHTVSLMPGADAVLRWLHEREVPAGIASNAQPYTLLELARELAPAGIGLGRFAPDLCFWSFAHGFSKPDPHVFRLLSARLQARGIAAGDTLMVGDRLDNDIAPARAQGWRTWQLGAASGGETGGDWAALGAFLARRS